MAKNDVVIKITNPRIRGEEASQIQRHRKAIINPNMFEGNGMAMNNIRHRLDTQYGQAASMRVVKGADDFKIVVHFPMTTSTIPHTST